MLPHFYRQGSPLYLVRQMLAPASMLLIAVAAKGLVECLKTLQVIVLFLCLCYWKA
jgi:hypothetical protein